MKQNTLVIAYSILLVQHTGIFLELLVTFYLSYEVAINIFCKQMRQSLNFPAESGARWHYL
jgi:hypothetical protein